MVLIRESQKYAGIVENEKCIHENCASDAPSMDCHPTLFQIKYVSQRMENGFFFFKIYLLFLNILCTMKYTYDV